MGFTDDLKDVGSKIVFDLIVEYSVKLGKAIADHVMGDSSDDSAVEKFARASLEAGAKAAEQEALERKLIAELPQRMMELAAEMEKNFKGIMIPKGNLPNILEGADVTFLEPNRDGPWLTAAEERERDAKRRAETAPTGEVDPPEED